MVKVYDDWKKRRKEIHFTRRWPFAIGLGLALGVLSLVQQGALSDLDSPCRVEVTAEILPIRSEPDPNGTRTYGNLRRGDVRGATTTVTNGYRQLADHTWARDQDLRPLPPTDRCAPS